MHWCKLPVAAGLDPLQERAGAVAGKVHERVAQVVARMVQGREIAIEARVDPLGGLGAVCEQVAFAAGIEGGAAEAVVPDAVGVQAPHRTHEWNSAERRRIGVRPGRRLLDAGVEKQLAIVVAQSAQHGVGGELDPVLVLGKPERVARVIATEVKEAKRASVDGHVVAVAREGPRVQVPVGDVVTRVAQEMDARHHARHQVDPALVDEVAAVRVDDAVGAQALGPPVEELVRRCAVAERDEAQVVGPGDQDVGLAGLLAVAWHRGDVVRGEHHAVLPGELGDRVERLEDPDVRIEVDDVVATGPAACAAATASPPSRAQGRRRCSPSRGIQGGRSRTGSAVRTALRPGRSSPRPRRAAGR